MITPNIIKVIIADDHELLRDGISTLIKTYKDIEVVAEASNGEQLIQLVEKYSPDVILMDIQMPILDGIEATRIISKKFPGVGIIALSMMENVYKIADIFAAGASGYLLKDAPKSEVIEGIYPKIPEKRSLIFYGMNIPSSLFLIAFSGSAHPISLLK